MAESIDGKKSKRERGKKRTITSLGDLGSAPELQNLPERPLEPEASPTPAEDVADVRDAIVEQAAETPEPTPEEAAAPAEPAPVEEPGFEARGSGEVNEPLPEDAPEWESLMRASPDGHDSAFGRKLWHAKDGGIYLSRSTARTPQYLAHGDSLSIRKGEYAGKKMYWDTNANGFSEVPPADVQDPAEQVGQKKRASSREERMTSPMSDATREVRQHNLRHTLSELNVSDEVRGKLSQAIDSVKTRAHVAAVLSVMKELTPPPEAPRALRTVEEAPATAPAVETVAATAQPEPVAGPEPVVDSRAVEMSAAEKRIREETKAKKKELRERLVNLRDSNVISQAFYDTVRTDVQGAKFPQQLAGVESDIARWEQQSSAPAEAPVVERAHPASEAVVATEPPVSAEPLSATQQSAAETAAQVLAESPVPPAAKKEKAESKQSIPPVRPPADVMKALQDDIRRTRRERIAEASGMPSADATQPPTDAIRRPGSAAAESHAADINDSPYKIDPRDYVGLEIMTVQEILADKNHQHFFGELIHSMNPNAAAVQLRYAQGTVTPEDMTFMTYAAHEYSKWNRMWEQLSEHLTDVDVDMLARRNEALHNIVGHVRGGGIAQLKNVLRHAAMKDQTTFLSIEHVVHEAHALRESRLGARANQKLEAIAARVGISRNDFETVFDFSSPEAEEKTRAHVVELLRAKAGNGRKTMDWLSRFSPTPLVGSTEIAADNVLADAKLALKGRFGITGKKLEKLGEHLEHATDGLDTLLKQQSVIDHVTRETLINEKEPFAHEVNTPVTFKETMVEAKKVTPEVFEKQIQEVAAKNPERWASDSSYRESTLSRMKAEATKKAKGNGGFWSWLLVTLCGTAFDKAARKSQAQAQAQAAPAAVH